MDPKTGKRERSRFHINQIQKNKADDVALKSNDILYVPDQLSLWIAATAAGAEVASYRYSGLSFIRLEPCVGDRRDFQSILTVEGR